METIEKTIEVDQPVQTVYNLWTQFENFPRFMSGIKEVRQLDTKHLHWKAEIGGKTKEWDAEISEQVADQRIAWSSTRGAENSGTMHFIALNPTKTRIILYLSYDPQGLVERMGNNLGVVSARVSGDLTRFKKFTEAQGAPLEDGLLSKAGVSRLPRIANNLEL
jgi:uncharacterized membrane protein